MSVSMSAPPPAASPRCCSPTARAWYFRSTSARGQLHPSLHGHPKIVSMEETDIRSFEGKRLPQRPDIVVIDVSFISLKAVLPVALSLAAAPMHLLALIKPQFEARAKTFQARHHPRRGSSSASLRRHRGLCHLAWLHAISRCFRPRSRAATAISNSSSARAVAERLVIDHVGHRGDGVCITGGESLFVPYTLGGETVEVERGPWPSRPPAADASRTAEPGAHRAVLPHISVPAAAAQSSTGRCEAYRAWKRAIVVDTLAQAGIACEVASFGRCPRRRPAPHHGPCSPRNDGELHTRLCRGGQPRHRRDRRIARSSIPACSGALDAARALAEALKPAGKPLDIQVTAASNGLDVDVRGSGPLTATLIATLSDIARAARPGAADPPRRTGIDARAADHRDRSSARHLAAGLFPASNGRRRGSIGGAGGGTLQARQAHRRPVLWRRPVRAAACERRQGCPPATAMPAQSQRCKKRRHRRQG